MKWFLVLAAVLLIGSGCTKLEQGLGSLTVSSSQVEVAVNAFDAAEVIASGYISFCKAKPMPPTCSIAGVTKIHDAVITGRTARNSLETFASGNTGTGDLSTLYNAMVAATSALNTVETQYGAKS